MAEQERPTFDWMDLVWLFFLLILAAADPIGEILKQLTLVAIGLFQIFENRFLKVAGPRGPAYSVLIKILLATLLVGHSGEINSSYYLIYFLPIVTAAMYFGAGEALLWTAGASVAYCSYLIPALMENSHAEVDVDELTIRNVFFFLAAIAVNRVVTENRRQAQRYQALAETLAETNRRLEQAQAEAHRSERLAALGQLSAGLAHELRNPLGVIKGSAEILGRKLPANDKQAVELAGYISSEVNRLNSLVTRFLDFARPLQLDRRSQPIPPLIDRALKAVHDRWPEAKVEVEREYSSNLPLVSVDEELCEQVFTNLALNAYEAMPTGGKLRVKVHATNGLAMPAGQRSPGVEIVFEDSGTGILAEMREQIFNPFFTTKKTGVGLGLSIISKIVDEHHGWIRAGNAPGKGARFEIFLPVGN